VVFSKREHFMLACWIAVISLLINFLMTVHMMMYTSRYFSYGLGTWWGGLETIDPYALLFKQLMDLGDILLMLAVITIARSSTASSSSSSCCSRSPST
jgi:hypothetical protein